MSSGTLNNCHGAQQGQLLSSDLQDRWVRISSSREGDGLGAVKDAILEGERQTGCGRDPWARCMYVCMLLGAREHRKGVKASDFLPFLKFYMCELQSCLQSREELVSMSYGHGHNVPETLELIAMGEAESEHRPGCPIPNTQLGQKLGGGLGHQGMPVSSGKVYDQMTRLLPSSNVFQAPYLHCALL